MPKPLFHDFESAIQTILENQREIKRELARLNKKLRKKPGPKPGNAAKIRKSSTRAPSRPISKSKSTKGKSPAAASRTKRKN